MAVIEEIQKALDNDELSVKMGVRLQLTLALQFYKDLAASREANASNKERIEALENESIVRWVGRNRRLALLLAALYLFVFPLVAPIVKDLFFNIIGIR